MADLATLESALRKADAMAQAGDPQAAADAKRIADAIREMQAGAPAGGSTADALVAGVAQGATFRTADEMKAGLRAFGDTLPTAFDNPLEAARQARIAEMGPGMASVAGIGTPATPAPTFGQNYDRRIGPVREELAAAREAHPVAFTGGEIAGGVAAGLLAPAGAPATTLPGAIARGAVGGGATGAAYGAGGAEGGPVERATGAAEGLAFGALFGAGANAALNIGSAAWRKAFRRSAERPTLDNLGAARDIAYKAVDDAGEVFSPAEIQTMAQSVRAAVDDLHYVADVDAQTRAALTILERNSGNPLTLGQVDNIRQNLWKRAHAAPDEPGVMAAIDAIDEMIASRGATNDLMAAARAAHARLKKAELIDVAFKKAQDQVSSTGSGGNVLNKYRQTVARIINDPKQARWFSADEKAVMQRLIDGNLAENLLRRVGKLAPSGNGLMLALNLVSGAHFGPGSLAVTGAASAAKAIADRSVEQGAERVMNVVAGAGAAARPPVTSPAFVNVIAGQEGAR